MTDHTSLIAEFEKNKRKADLLKDRKNKLEIEIAAARRQQSILEEEADLLFGTHNLAELQQLLEKLQSENRHKLDLFTKNIESAERDIVEIEQTLSGLTKPLKSASFS